MTQTCAGINPLRVFSAGRFTIGCGETKTGEKLGTAIFVAFPVFLSRNILYVTYNTLVKALSLEEERARSSTIGPDRPNGARPCQRANLQGSTRRDHRGPEPVFTHCSSKPEERPLRDRDHNSTSHLAEIAPAREFGGLLRAEALRRGMAQAKVVVFLGDGAAWVWEIARINFPAPSASWISTTRRNI